MAIAHRNILKTKLDGFCIWEKVKYDKSKEKP